MLGNTRESSVERVSAHSPAKRKRSTSLEEEASLAACGTGTKLAESGPALGKRLRTVTGDSERAGTPDLIIGDSDLADVLIASKEIRKIQLLEARLRGADSVPGSPNSSSYESSIPFRAPTGSISGRASASAPPPDMIPKTDLEKSIGGESAFRESTSLDLIPPARISPTRLSIIPGTIDAYEPARKEFRIPSPKPSETSNDTTVPTSPPFNRRDSDSNKHQPSFSEAFRALVDGDNGPVRAYEAALEYSRTYDGPVPLADHADGNDLGRGPRKKKKSPHFTEMEDEVIQRGYALHGDNWEEIISWGNLDRDIRTPSSVKGRFQRLQVAAKRKGSTSTGLASNEQHKHFLETTSNHSTTSTEEPMGMRTPRQRHSEAGSAFASPSAEYSNDASSFAFNNALFSPQSRPTPPATKKIHEYFAKPGSHHGYRINAGNGEHDQSKPGEDVPRDVFISKQRHIAELEHIRSKLKRVEDECETWRKQLAEANTTREELAVRLENAEKERTIFDDRMEQLRNTAQEQIANLEGKFNKQLDVARTVLTDALRQQAEQKARAARQRLNEDSLRLGTVIFERHGIDYHERWQEGYVFAERQQQLQQINKEREELEKRRKTLAKRLKLSKVQPGGDAGDGITKPDGTPLLTRGNSSSNYAEYITQTEYNELDEIAKIRLTTLKKEENEVQQQLEKLTAERDVHIKEWRRIRDEDQSRFNKHPVLNGRYLLLELIGKGGFSEVHKAFDLVEMRAVACKIHSLNEQWSDERKQSYIKHSIREYRIHKTLVHPRVVRLYDVFEYDHLSFCTVLEYVCEGKDLESHLQMMKTLPEKEARSIIMQVVSALRYMNELEKPIIHYDLKPGNILYHRGEVKVTDFGLSKIVEQAEAPTFRTGIIGAKDIDLTSQGAGTYWYLPPEVFSRRSHEPIKISSKVDVWSLGCIFYELLYGVKPFGNDKSQQTILEESTITRDAQRLNFPAKPVVSAETKEFIRKCLEYRKDRRPDVLTLAKDPYLSSPTPAASSSSGGTSRSGLAKAGVP
ncbi:hypothetical protein HDU85_005201 [Gaertneriomyces sp. JEL0708]|nr:hypothetical protein HDU85_005201 [Gaertneriomyces sp. JEL0708]